jgi:hypothetical protein
LDEKSQSTLDEKCNIMMKEGENWQDKMKNQKVWEGNY